MSAPQGDGIMSDSCASRLRAVVEGMTPGPWDTWIEGERGAWGGSPLVRVPSTSSGATSIEVNNAEDARGIVALRNAADALVALVAWVEAQHTDAVVRQKGALVPRASRVIERETAPLLARLRSALPAVEGSET